MRSFNSSCGDRLKLNARSWFPDRSDNHFLGWLTILFLFLSSFLVSLFYISCKYSEITFWIPRISIHVTFNKCIKLQINILRQYLDLDKDTLDFHKLCVLNNLAKFQSEHVLNHM